VKGENQPTMIDALMSICTIRGVLVGSRKQFEAMNRAIEANDIKPVVDSKVFKLEDVKEAYQVSYEMVLWIIVLVADLRCSTCGTRSTSQRLAFRSIRCGRSIETIRLETTIPFNLSTIFWVLRSCVSVREHVVGGRQ
jgi:hypothetical protein